MKSAIIGLFCALTLLLHGMASAQEKDVVFGKQFTIDSKILNEQRKIRIYLPPKYGQNNQNYPVLYLLDGDVHFFHGSSTSQFLSQNGIIPELIVVGILNIDRNRDFSPTHVTEVPTSGGAENFLNFLDKELIPFINQSYRTTPFRVLMGHSFGGAFATYSFLTKPDLFDGYIAISPYLQYDNNNLVSHSANLLGKHYQTQKSFYMTVGDEPAYFDPLRNFSDQITSKTDSSVIFKYVIMNNENHATIPYLSIFNGLQFIFSEWQLPEKTMKAGLQAIDLHYKHISELYHTFITTPEFIINRLGYNYLQLSDYTKAINTFTENVKRYPKSANVYDSLGEAYEKSNNLEIASKNYKKAYELGLLELNPNVMLFKANFDRVTNR
jgi:predicted alpha/beta superfamily hydrolase